MKNGINIFQLKPAKAELPELVSTMMPRDTAQLDRMNDSQPHKKASTCHLTLDNCIALKGHYQPNADKLSSHSKIENSTFTNIVSVPNIKPSKNRRRKHFRAKTFDAADKDHKHLFTNPKGSMTPNQSPTLSPTPTPTKKSKYITI